MLASIASFSKRFLHPFEGSWKLRHQSGGMLSIQLEEP